MKNFLQKIFFKEKSVYCPYCSSCGEVGCCSPTICVQHKKGFYCELNLNELKLSHRVLHNFYNWIEINKEENKEAYDKLNKLLINEIKD